MRRERCLMTNRKSVHYISDKQFTFFFSFSQCNLFFLIPGSVICGPVKYKVLNIDIQHRKKFRSYISAVLFL